MEDPDEFDRQQEETASAPEPEIVYARFFDITILDADGDAFEPKAPVRVSIELLDAGADEQVLRNADTLPGWYDVSTKKFYAPGTQSDPITKDTVFYADWIPTTYPQERGGRYWALRRRVYAP